MSTLTLHAVWLVVGIHLTLADLIRNGADTRYLEPPVVVGVKLRNFDAQLTARVGRPVQHQLDAVRRLWRSRLVQMPPNLMECAERVSVDGGWNKERVSGAVCQSQVLPFTESLSHNKWGSKITFLIRTHTHESSREALMSEAWKGIMINSFRPLLSKGCKLLRKASLVRSTLTLPRRRPKMRQLISAKVETF